MDKKPLVSVIIVTLNNLDWLLKSLKNLYSQNYKNIEVIITDNGSTDNTYTVIQKKFPKATLIRSDTNLGFGRGANLGIKKAKGKYIFIYNDDAFLEKDTIQQMVNIMEKNPKLGSMQGTILFSDKKTIVESAGSYLTNLGILEKKERFKFDKKINTSYEVFSANLPMIRSSVLKKVGVFDDDYFLYFEEADLSWRIWLAGYTIKYFSDPLMYHARGVTTKKIAKPRVLQSTYQNRIDSLIKNLETKNILWMVPLNILVSLGGVLIFLLKGKFHEAYAIFKGIFINFFRLGKILKKRRYIQKSRKITDKELFSRVFKFMDFKFLIDGAINYFTAW